MPSVYGAIDLQKNEIRNAVVQNLGSAPSAPTKGQLYFNSTGGDNTLYWYDGTSWVPAKASSNLPLSSSASTLVVGGSASGGSASDAARGDHVHGMPAFGISVAQTSFGSVRGNGTEVTLARSDHTHGTPTHDASAHGLIPLSALAAPTGAVNFNGQKVSGLIGPVGGDEAVPKWYVDGLVQGLNNKASVFTTTTGNLPLSGTSATNTDVFVLSVGNRVLVKNQTNPAENGIYVVAAGAWSRATDMDSWPEAISAYTFVETGNTLADTGWVCTVDAGGGSLGTTAITWVQFSAAGQIIAGAGLTKTGNSLDVGAGTGILVGADSISIDDSVVATDAQVTSAISAHAAAADPHTGYQLESEKGTGNGYAGLTSGLVPIAQLPTGTAGTQVALGNHNHTGVYPGVGTTVSAGAGLTGGGDLSANRTIDVVAGDSSLSVAADSVVVNTAVIATRAYVDAAAPAGMTKKFAAALVGTTSPEVVTHNLNTRDIHLQVLNGGSPYTAVEVDWDATTLTTATIRYSPNLGAGHRVVVIG